MGKKINDALKLGKDLLTKADPSAEGLTDVNKIIKSLIPDSGSLAIVNGYQKSLSLIVQMDQSFAKLTQTMGFGQNQTSVIKENLSKSTEQVIAMGGKYEDAVKVQEDFLSTTKKAALLNSDIASKVYATSKVTGVAADQLFQGFLDAGYEADHIEESMLKTQSIANKMGVNAQAVSAMVVANLDKLNKYSFDGGVEGLAKMAGKAAMFRIDMGETFELADKLLSPENAIEVASALQRLGGSASQLTNPLKLMDLAQNNVPELQNQLAKLTEKYTFFDEKTKSFQIMPGARRELKALEGALGVSYDSLTKMSIEGAKLKKKMSEISFTGLNFSKEQQEQIANLSTINKKTGKYEIEFKNDAGKTMTTTLDKLSELSKEDREAFDEYLANQTEEQAKDPQKQMIDIAKEQLGKADQMIAALNQLVMAPQLAMAGGGAGEALLTKSREINKERLSDYISENSFNKLAPKLSDASESIVKISELFANKDWVGVEREIENLGPELKSIVTTSFSPLFDTIKDIVKLPESIKKLFEGEAEDFIWRPGQGVQKFRADDIVIGGTDLMNQKNNVTPSVQQTTAQDILQNMSSTNISKTESTVGGEITLKVMVDSTGNMSNLSLETAKMIGDRVADSMKNSPDLQEKFMSVLNNRLNNRLPIKPGGR